MFHPPGSTTASWILEKKTAKKRWDTWVWNFFSKILQCSHMWTPDLTCEHQLQHGHKKFFCGCAECSKLRAKLNTRLTCRVLRCRFRDSGICRSKSLGSEVYGLEGVQHHVGKELEIVICICDDIPYNLDREFQNYIGQSVSRQISDEKRPLLWSHLLFWVYNSHMENWEVVCRLQFLLLLLCKWAYSSEMMSSRFVVDLDNNFTFQKKIMSKFVFWALIEFLFSELRKLHSIIGQFVAIGKLMMGGRNNHHVFWEVLLNNSKK